jgi:hypothetical protein
MGAAVPIPIIGQVLVIGAVFCSCSYLILYLIANLHNDRIANNSANLFYMPET